jgi:hypothetical protein
VVATWWSWLISDGSIEGGGFLKKKKVGWRLRDEE